MTVSPITIHQIWLQGVDKIPAKYKDDIKLISTLNPTYKHILWSDKLFHENILNNSEYDKDFINGIKNFYSKLTLIHLKVDYMRYVILYLLGGIYLDMDIKVIKSFESLTQLINEYDCILEELEYSKIQSLIISGYPETLNNGIIITKSPGSFFLKQLLNSVNESIISHEDQIKNAEERTHNSSLLICEITGPKKFTTVYNGIPQSEKDKIYITKHKEFFCTHNCNKIKDTTILKHRSDLTWFGNQYHSVIRFYISDNFQITCGIIFGFMIIGIVLVSLLIENYKIRVTFVVIFSLLLTASLTGLIIKTI